MKYYSWNNNKNEELKKERGISFEDVIYYIENRQLLAILKHTNQNKYPGQKLFVLEIDNYAYLIPFVETEKEIFLKTINKQLFRAEKLLKNIWRQKMKYKLDNEEKEILKDFEEGAFAEIPDMETEIAKHATYAKATFLKNKRINIRISQKDLESIQRKALEEGIPYQTLISSLLHRYISGKLVEKDRILIKE